MSEDVQGFRFRATPRAPLRRVVRLRFDRIGGSVSGSTTDLSTEGLFVATSESKPIGTLVQFEFEDDAGETIQGLADIVWVREVGQGPDREAGMGLHFRYVDPRSRELIAAIVRDVLAEMEPTRGGETAPPEASPATGSPPLREGSEGPAAEPRLASAPPPPIESGSSLEAPSVPRTPEEPLASSSAGEPTESSTEPIPIPLAPALPRADPPPPQRDAGRSALAPPGGGAVWSGSDEWLRPENAAEQRASVPRGGMARRGSRAPLWGLLALLLVAVAAGAAIYYRRLNGPDAASEPPTWPDVAAVVEELPDPGPEPAEEGVEPSDEPAAPEDGAGAATAEPGGAAEERASVAAPAEEDSAPAEPPIAVAEPAPKSGTLRMASEVSDTTTLMRITAPWEITAADAQWFRLDAPPRYLVKVKGDQAVPATVDSPHVRRIRIGVHSVEGVAEVHFVFDLASADVRAHAAILGGAVVVTFSR